MSSMEENTLSDDGKQCLLHFHSWTSEIQMNFVSQLLERMTFYQHGQVDMLLRPLLMRDFIADLAERGMSHIVERILLLLDAESLANASKVSYIWGMCIEQGYVWKRFIERKAHQSPLWRKLLHDFDCHNYLRMPSSSSCLHNTIIKSPEYYRCLYPQILQCIQTIQQNWQEGKYQLQAIDCHSEGSKGVYCIQYDDDKIISGLRDNTIKVWGWNTPLCRKVLRGHAGSVLCLQYDSQMIISGSSDATVRIWNVTGPIEEWDTVNMLTHHTDAVLHLRFADNVLVTCSKDRSIAVWDMKSPERINLRQTLPGHRAAVNVVDFDSKYIVSASGDRTIKVWTTSSCNLVRTLQGHKRGIACLQYRNGIIVSGSSDFSIRIWDVEDSACLRVLEGHKELVRCIRFDDERIVSGSYDGQIIVWDMRAALNPLISPNHNFRICTLHKHTGRVFRLQFDDVKIVSSSHDGTILVWNFSPSPEQYKNSSAVKIM